MVVIHVRMTWKSFGITIGVESSNTPPGKGWLDGKSMKILWHIEYRGDDRCSISGPSAKSHH